MNQTALFFGVAALGLGGWLAWQARESEREAREAFSRGNSSTIGVPDQGKVEGEIRHEELPVALTPKPPDVVREPNPTVQLNPNELDKIEVIRAVESTVTRDDGVTVKFRDHRGEDAVVFTSPIATAPVEEPADSKVFNFDPRGTFTRPV